MKTLFSLYRQSLAGLRAMLVATLVLGVAYPLVVQGAAAVAAPWASQGSMITADGEHTTDPDEAVGSALIGQVVDDPDLFQPRPSAAGDGYDTLASAGSNLGPESPDLVELVTQRQAEVAAREGVDESEVPVDAVTASGSGLDPHVSVAYAALQAPRVARAHGLDVAAVEALVREHTDGRTLGVLGESRVNVLELNAAVLRAADGD
ncbi:potassium-transporting ATPase subunit KdpC [Aeromicrobium massiliense]|uniref:potassium-transporting ATPase subunit KdpC n=1 Tax=Aeromicrobium massiliense TaxID=1464554 RepID=UPI0002E7563C|nr:potassium-transporting ATPase subunit KdpC [Aeromicrobium massiliense]